MGSGEPDVCFLTTSGRHTGRPHRVEIWFAAHADVVYLLAGDGDRSDWVRNLVVSPAVTLEIDGRSRPSRARLVTDPDEEALSRRLLMQKYEARGHGDLSTWGRTALPVAVAWPGPVGEPGPRSVTGEDVSPTSVSRSSTVARTRPLPA